MLEDNQIILLLLLGMLSSQWHHNERDDISTHQPHNCLLNRLFRQRSKKTSKLCVTGEFLTQMASNVENVSIWWRHHDYGYNFINKYTRLHRNRKVALVITEDAETCLQSLVTTRAVILTTFLFQCNLLWFRYAKWPFGSWSSLVQVTACHLFGIKPLPEPMLTYCQLDHVVTTPACQRSAANKNIAFMIKNIVLGTLPWPSSGLRISGALACDWHP